MASPWAIIRAGSLSESSARIPCRAGRRRNREVLGKQLESGCGGVKLKKSDQQQLWTQAQRRCRLSDEAVRMAKELGFGPRSLIKNIPAPTQQWKAPAEDWVRDLYEKRHRKASRKKPSGTGAATPAAEDAP